MQGYKSTTGAAGQMSIRHRRRASAVMEMALVCPLLFYLAFGVVEYGYYLYAKNSLQGAARDGAREAILSTATNTTVQSVVDAAMQTAGMQNCGYSVTTVPATIAGTTAGTACTVTVSTTWGNFHVHPLPTVFGGISPTKSVSVAATMRHE